MRKIPFKAGGALTDGYAYIERQADRDALAHLRAMDYLLVIEPRQQGKTSLINHLMRLSTPDNVAFAYVDVTTPDHSTAANWYQSLCPRILRQLRNFIPHNQWPPIPQSGAEWRDFLSNVALFANDANRYVVIALDEIGALTFPGATAFFSVLRDVYNSRQAEPELKHLTFWLVGAFHPRDLIKDDKISPFNIAQRIRLPDFTLAQVHELMSKGEWSDDQATALAERIYTFTDGQPYLTQLLCTYLRAEAVPADVDASVERLRREDENHLPPLLERLTVDRKLREYVAKIQTGARIKFYPRENRRQAQLELLGILKADDQGYCTIRNHIYESALVNTNVFDTSEFSVMPSPSAAKKKRTTRPSIFISYSHKDEKEKDHLLSQLGVLQNAGLIDLWSDDRIVAGANWESEIGQVIARARVAILLISANFLTSDFILNKQIPTLLQRHERERLTVFPVIAKACAWRTVDWLTKMNIRPKNGRPVWGDGGRHVNEDLAIIAEEVATIIRA